MPSNGALMGSNGLTVWLGNCLECLLALDDPMSSSGLANPFTHQCSFSYLLRLGCLYVRQYYQFKFLGSICLDRLSC